MITIAGGILLAGFAVIVVGLISIKIYDWVKF